MRKEPDLIGDEATLQKDETEVTVAEDSNRDSLDTNDDLGNRYAIGKEIDRGGMGKVLECRDTLVHRDIAIKINEREAGGDRFLREARLQGRLEHPSVVPLYDLGTTKGGEYFFTMKRIRGQTFKNLLKQPAREYPLRRALGDFGRVCEAVAYAHNRGIVHRDIKPSNVMVGEFGAVYLIDWGVAKQLGVSDEESSAAASPDDDVSLTKTGRAIGTPAYMAPEQRVGLSDRRSDVYSLGLVLRTILAREEVPPPELLALVDQATQLDPDMRQNEVQEVHQAIERFLDGDRDALRRQELADDCLATVETTLAQSTISQEEYKQAMQNVGRALALAPEHKNALSAFVRIMERQPDIAPLEVAARLVESRERARVKMGRPLFLAYAGIFVLLPVFLLCGLRSWIPVALVAGVWSLLLLVVALVRKGERMKEELVIPELACVNLAIASVSLLTGWLAVLPMLACVVAAGYAMWMEAKRRWWIVFFGCATLVIPLLLFRADLIPDALMVGSDWPIVHLGLELDFLTSLAFLGASVLILFTCVMFFGAIGDTLARVELELHMHSWQLRKLAPAV